MANPLFQNSAGELDKKAAEIERELLKLSGELTGKSYLPFEKKGKLITNNLEHAKLAYILRTKGGLSKSEADWARNIAQERYLKTLGTINSNFARQVKNYKQDNYFLPDEDYQKGLKDLKRVRDDYAQNAKDILTQVTSAIDTRYNALKVDTRDADAINVEFAKYQTDIEKTYDETAKHISALLKNKTQLTEQEIRSLQQALRKINREDIVVNKGFVPHTVVDSFNKSQEKLNKARTEYVADIHGIASRRGITDFSKSFNPVVKDLIENYNYDKSTLKSFENRQGKNDDVSGVVKGLKARASTTINGKDVAVLQKDKLNTLKQIGDTIMYDLETIGDQYTNRMSATQITLRQGEKEAQSYVVKVNADTKKYLRELLDKAKRGEQFTKDERRDVLSLTDFSSELGSSLVKISHNLWSPETKISSSNVSFWTQALKGFEILTGENYETKQLSQKKYDNMVEDAFEGLEKGLTALGIDIKNPDITIGGHNIGGFDNEYMRRLAMKNGKIQDFQKYFNKTIDTLALARGYLYTGQAGSNGKTLASMQLADLAEFLLPDDELNKLKQNAGGGLHTASYDTLVNQKVLNALVQQILDDKLQPLADATTVKRGQLGVAQSYLFRNDRSYRKDVNGKLLKGGWNDALFQKGHEYEYGGMEQIAEGVIARFIDSDTYDEIIYEAANAQELALMMGQVFNGEFYDQVAEKYESSVARIFNKNGYYNLQAFVNAATSKKASPTAKARYDTIIDTDRANNGNTANFLKGLLDRVNDGLRGADTFTKNTVINNIGQKLGITQDFGFNTSNLRSLIEKKVTRSAQVRKQEYLDYIKNNFEQFLDTDTLDILLTNIDTFNISDANMRNESNPFFRIQQMLVNMLSRNKDFTSSEYYKNTFSQASANMNIFSSQNKQYTDQIINEEIAKAQAYAGGKDSDQVLAQLYKIIPNDIKDKLTGQYLKPRYDKLKVSQMFNPSWDNADFTRGMFGDGSLGYKLKQIVEAAKDNNLAVHMGYDGKQINLGFYGLQDAEKMFNGDIPLWENMATVPIAISNNEDFLTSQGMDKLNYLIPRMNKDTGNLFLTTAQEAQADAILDIVKSNAFREHILGTDSKTADYRSAQSWLHRGVNELLEKVTSSSSYNILKENADSLKDQGKSTEAKIVPRGLMYLKAYAKDLQERYSLFKDGAGNIVRKEDVGEGRHNSEIGDELAFLGKVIAVLSSGEQALSQINLGLTSDSEKTLLNSIITDPQYQNLKADLQKFVDTFHISYRGMKEENTLAGFLSLLSSADYVAGAHFADPSNRSIDQNANFIRKRNAPQAGMQNRVYMERGVALGVDYEDSEHQLYQAIKATDDKIKEVWESMRNDPIWGQYIGNLEAPTVHDDSVIISQALQQDLLGSRTDIRHIHGDINGAFVKRFGLSDQDLKTLSQGGRIDFAQTGQLEAGELPLRIADDITIQGGDIVRAIENVGGDTKVWIDRLTEASQFAKILLGGMRVSNNMTLSNEVMKEFVLRLSGAMGHQLTDTQAANIHVIKQGNPDINSSYRKEGPSIIGRFNNFISFLDKQIKDNNIKLEDAIKAVENNPVLSKLGTLVKDDKYGGVKFNYQASTGANNQLLDKNGNDFYAGLSEEDKLGFFGYDFGDIKSIYTQISESLSLKGEYNDYIEAVTANLANLVPYQFAVGNLKGDELDQWGRVKFAYRERDALARTHNSWGLRGTELAQAWESVINRMSETRKRAQDVYKTIQNTMDKSEQSYIKTTALVQDNKQLKFAGNDEANVIRLRVGNFDARTLLDNEIALTSDTISQIDASKGIISSQAYQDTVMGQVWGKINQLNYDPSKTKVFLDFGDLPDNFVPHINGQSFSRLAVPLIQAQQGKQGDIILGELDREVQGLVSKLVGNLNSNIEPYKWQRDLETSTASYLSTSRDLLSKDSTLYANTDEVIVGMSSYFKAAGQNLMDDFEDDRANSLIVSAEQLRRMLTSGDTVDEKKASVQTLSQLLRKLDEINELSPDEIKNQFAETQVANIHEQEQLIIDKIIEAVDVGKKAAIPSLVGRYPSTSGKDRRYAGLKVDKAGVTSEGAKIGAALALALNADFDGDNIAATIGWLSNKFNSDDEFNKAFTQGSEAVNRAKTMGQMMKAKLKQKYSDAFKTDITSEQRLEKLQALITEEQSGDLNQLLSFISKDNKRYIGRFSNLSTDFRNMMRDAGLDETGADPNSDTSISGAFLRAILEIFEQEAISSKKVAERIRQHANKAYGGTATEEQVATYAANELDKLYQTLQSAFYTGNSRKFTEALKMAEDIGINVTDSRQIWTAMADIQSDANFDKSRFTNIHWLNNDINDVNQGTISIDALSSLFRNVMGSVQNYAGTRSIGDLMRLQSGKRDYTNYTTSFDKEYEYWRKREYVDSTGNVHEYTPEDPLGGKGTQSNPLYVYVVGENPDKLNYVPPKVGVEDTKQNNSNSINEPQGIFHGSNSTIGHRYNAQVDTIEGLAVDFNKDNHTYTIQGTNQSILGITSLRDLLLHGKNNQVLGYQQGQLDAALTRYINNPNGNPFGFYNQYEAGIAKESDFKNAVNLMASGLKGDIIHGAIHDINTSGYTVDNFIADETLIERVLTNSNSVEGYNAAFNAGAEKLRALNQELPKEEVIKAVKSYIDALNKAGADFTGLSEIPLGVQIKGKNGEVAKFALKFDQLLTNMFVDNKTGAVNGYESFQISAAKMAASIASNKEILLQQPAKRITEAQTELENIKQAYGEGSDEYKNAEITLNNFIAQYGKAEQALENISKLAISVANIKGNNTLLEGYFQYSDDELFSRILDAYAIQYNKGQQYSPEEINSYLMGQKKTAGIIRGGEETLTDSDFNKILNNDKEILDVSLKLQKANQNLSLLPQDSAQYAKVTAEIAKYTEQLKKLYEIRQQLSEQYPVTRTDAGFVDTNNSNFSEQQQADYLNMIQTSQEKMNLAQREHEDKVQAQAVAEYLKALNKSAAYDKKIDQVNKLKEGATATRLNDLNKYQQSLLAAQGVYSPILSRFDEESQTLQIYNAQTQQYEKMKLNATNFAKIQERIKQIELERQANVQRLNATYNNQKSIFQMLFGTMRQAVNRFFDYSAAYMIINKFKQAIQSVITYTAQLDQKLVNLQIATGNTRRETQGMMRDYNELAKVVGKTTTAVADAANDWLRAGYEGKEATELVKSSMYLSVLGMMDAQTATTDLISVLKGWKLAASDVIGVVDKLVKVDMNAAVNSGELAEAMQMTNYSAQQSGLAMDTLIGILATNKEVTQRSAQVVGNSWKTILARIQNVKAGKFAANYEDMQSDNYQEQDWEALNDVETTLKSIGIQMRETATQWRSSEDILNEIASKWDTYDKVTQSAIANAMAGTRQRENFIATMSNWDSVMEYAQIAAGAAGTADIKMKAYTDSIEAAKNRITAAVEDIVMQINASDLLKGFYNTIAYFTENIQTVSEIFATLFILSNLSEIISMAQRGFIGLTQSMFNFSNLLKTISSTITNTPASVSTSILNDRIKMFEGSTLALGLTGVEKERFSSMQANLLGLNNAGLKQALPSYNNASKLLGTSLISQYKRNGFQNSGNIGVYNSIATLNNLGINQDTLKIFKEFNIGSNIEGMKNAYKTIETVLNGGKVHAGEFSQAMDKLDEAMKTVNKSTIAQVKTLTQQGEEVRKQNRQMVQGMAGAAGGVLGGIGYGNLGQMMLGSTGQLFGSAIGAIGTSYAASTLMGMGGAAFTSASAIAPWGIIIGAIVSAIIGGIKNGIDQALQEAEKKVNDLQNKYVNASSLLAVGKQFDELSRGVNSLGQNISLTDDEYEKFLQYNNQILETFPELWGYTDSTGQKFVEMGGTITSVYDKIIEKMKETQAEADRAKFEKTGGFLGLFQTSLFGEALKDYGATNTKYHSQIKAIDALFNGELKNYHDDTIKATAINTIKDLAKEANLYSDMMSDNDFVRIISNTQYGVALDANDREKWNQFLTRLKTQRADIVNEIGTNYSNISGYVDSYLRLTGGQKYENMTDNQRKLFAEIEFEMVDADGNVLSEEAAKQKVTQTFNEFMNVVGNEKANAAINAYYTFDKAKSIKAYEEMRKALLEYLKNILNTVPMTEEAKNQLVIALGFQWDGNIEGITDVENPVELMKKEGLFDKVRNSDNRYTERYIRNNLSYSEAGIARELLKKREFNSTEELIRAVYRKEFSDESLTGLAQYYKTYRDIIKEGKDLTNTEQAQYTVIKDQLDSWASALKIVKSDYKDINDYYDALAEKAKITGDLSLFGTSSQTPSEFREKYSKYNSLYNYLREDFTGKWDASQLETVFSDKDLSEAFVTGGPNAVKKSAKDFLDNAEEGYKNTLKGMVKTSEGVYTAILKKNSKLVDNIKENYGIDLNNFKTIQEAELQIAETMNSLLEGDTGEWVTNLAKQYGIDVENFSKSQDGKIKVYQELLKAMGAGDFSPTQNQLNEIYKEKYGYVPTRSVGTARTQEVIEQAFVNELETKHKDAALKKTQAAIDEIRKITDEATGDLSGGITGFGEDDLKGKAKTYLDQLKAAEAAINKEYESMMAFQENRDTYYFTKMSANLKLQEEELMRLLNSGVDEEGKALTTKKRLEYEKDLYDVRVKSANLDDEEVRDKIKILELQGKTGYEMAEQYKKLIETADSEEERLTYEKEYRDYQKQQIEDKITEYGYTNISLKLVQKQLETLKALALTEKERMEYEHRISENLKQQYDIQRKIYEMQNTIRNFKLDYLNPYLDEKAYSDAITKNRETLQVMLDDAKKQYTSKWREAYSANIVQYGITPEEAKKAADNATQEYLQQVMDGIKAIGDLIVREVTDKIDDIVHKIDNLEKAKPQEWIGISQIESSYAAFISLYQDQEKELKKALERANELTDEQIKELVDKYNDAYKTIHDMRIQALSDKIAFQDTQLGAVEWAINEQIDDLNKQKDIINKIYDEEIAKIDKKNNSIERTNRLIELQNKLLEANREKEKIYRQGIGWVKICP